MKPASIHVLKVSAYTCPVKILRTVSLVGAFFRLSLFAAWHNNMLACNIYHMRH